MGMKTQVDVLIIGGGPAGLAAGIVCASHGLRTLVCEKRSLPADKPCGEGVMPTGLAHLKRLGVTKYLSIGQHFPFDGICYYTPHGVSACTPFREGPGWGIPRRELSAALLLRARELSCLEICTGVTVTPVRGSAEDQPGTIYVEVGGDRVETRLLIGADGLNSVVRRWSGLQGPKGSHQRWGVRQHFQMRPWSSKVEVYWRDGLEAYVTPCGEDLIGVAFLWDRERDRHLPGGRRLLPALLEGFPALAQRLRHAPATDAPLAVGPMQRQAIRQTADGVLLIGDAAGYLDALTGEGISLALAQAVALEKTVVPLLLSCHDQITQTDLKAYQEIYRSIVRPYYTMTHLMLWLSHHPVLAERVIGLLAHSPRVFQYLLSANMGLFPPRVSRV